MLQKFYILDTSVLISCPKAIERFLEHDVIVPYVVLNELANFDEYIDFYYLKNIQPKYKTIVLNDIITTDLSSSDTSNKSKIMIKRLDYIKKNN